MNDGIGNNGTQLPLHLQLQQLLQQQNQLRTGSAEGHAGMPSVGSTADRPEAGGISACLTQQSNLMQPPRQSVGGVVGNHSEQMTQQLALQLSLLKQQLANSGPIPNDQSTNTMAASGFVGHGNDGLIDRAPGPVGGLPSPDPLLLQHLFQNQNLTGIPSNIINCMNQPRPASPSSAGFGRAQQNHQQQGSNMMAGSSFGVSDFMAPPEPNRLMTPSDGMRVPCRARGMPKSHNADTAYFIIPNDVQHGEGLRCSHYECQNKGIRFVYCKVCEVPVAKINFSTRHKHREEQSGTSSKKRNKASTSTTPLQSDPTSASRNDSTNDSQKRRRRDPSKLGGDNVGTLQQTTPSAFGHSLNQPRTPQTTNELMVVNKSSAILGGGKFDAIGTVLGRKQEEWLSLLRERPSLTNEGGMVDWLRKVILVSQSGEDTEQRDHSERSQTKEDTARGINKLIAEGLKAVVDPSSSTRDDGSSSPEKGLEQTPVLQEGAEQQEEEGTSQEQSSETTTKQ